MKNKACFLDRDGVINVEVNYLHESEKVVLEDGVIEALKLLQGAGFILIVVTNQAGVAKGYYPESDIQNVHDKISELLAVENVKIDKFYHCPHHGDFTGECDCRKPKTGMFEKAIKEFNIDVTQSYMIGDRMSDIQAGEKIGCVKSILVKTGYGSEIIKNSYCSKLPTANNLLDAVKKYIM